MTVHLVLAPNPGPMTATGTNTWVVESAGEYVVIDPGPVIVSHLEAVIKAVAHLSPVGVLVTHGHPDHAPAAPSLAERLGVPTSGPASADFRPDRPLADGDEVEFGVERLVALTTPGHTPDSMCYRVGDALFTGDHIMGGSTVMVEDMKAYLTSLRRLQGLGLGTLYPGHGPILRDPDRVVSDYISHRLEREAQIVAAVRSGAATVGEVVQRVYAAVDPSLHPAAAVSVTAHLYKLVGDGLVEFDGGGWAGRVRSASS